MNKFVLLLLAFITSIYIQAQTYSNSIGGAIPDAGPVVQFPIVVSGLQPATIDTTFGLETVCFSINHTYDADLNIALQSPDGTIVALSTGNGGGNDNYTNTCLNGFAANSIVGAAAPFTGTFRPQAYLGLLNNGQNANGTWMLLVQDVAGLDTGVVINWSITFGTTPSLPFIFSSSNLPIVVINTFNQAIPDEPKINARMGIIYNGVGIRNYTNNAYTNYNNKIGIELHGSSSQGFPQKSYGIETRNSQNVQHDTLLLGMPAEHDWILYAPYDDKTCLRNVLSYAIANETGHYASRTRYCEVVVNNQYQGIYVLMEKIKRDSSRVNIAKLTVNDVAGDSLTGGYIIKIDKQTGNGGAGWNSNFLSSVGSNIYYQYDYPKDGTITTVQQAYIQSYVDSFEVALSGPNFTDPLIGYKKYIGVNSFIDYFILNEISKNVDGYRLSTYLHKDKQSNGGKLKAGPAWDFNLAWWNADYCQGDSYTGWAYQFNTVCGSAWQVPFWWDRLMEDDNFRTQLNCRWIDLRQSTLSLTSLTNFIDSVAAYLDEAQQRHFQAWPILGVYTWPNPSPLPTSYAEEIAAIKQWIQNRVAWIDAQWPGDCFVGLNKTTELNNNYLVFPNPANELVYVQATHPINGISTIKLMDVLGNVYINQPSTNANELKINVSGLAKGIYFLEISNQQGSVTQKLCIQ